MTLLFSEIKSFRMLRAGLALVVLASCCLGCTASLSEIQAYGSASKTLGTAATQALQLTDSSTIDRQIYTIAADKNTGPTGDTFKGLFNDKAASLNLRLAVLQHLTGYASALEELASADLSADVDKASTALKGELSSLSKTFKKASGNTDDLVSDSDLNLIAAAVDGIGKGTIEYKKREAIRQVILKANPAVQQSATLLASELGRDSELAKFVEANMRQMQLQMHIGYNDERIRPNSTFAERLATLQRIRTQAIAAETAPDFFESVSKGAAAMARAHKAMFSAAERNDFTSADVIKSVNELIGFAKDVQKYHDSLNSTAAE